MSSNFYRGTQVGQDSKYGEADKKVMKKMKFARCLQTKVEISKVNMDVMGKWISERITALLGVEDEIVVGTCINFLTAESTPDPKKLQLQMTVFLEKATGSFMEELWTLLLDAQASRGGIPSAFLEQKKRELAALREAEQKRQAEFQKCAKAVGPAAGAKKRLRSQHRRWQWHRRRMWRRVSNQPTRRGRAAVTGKRPRSLPLRWTPTIRRRRRLQAARKQRPFQRRKNRRLPPLRRCRESGAGRLLGRKSASIAAAAGTAAATPVAMVAENTGAADMAAAMAVTVTALIGIAAATGTAGATAADPAAVPAPAATGTGRGRGLDGVGSVAGAVPFPDRRTLGGDTGISIRETAAGGIGIAIPPRAT
ncbi:unnamed protein product, partial [Phaeothamnion confervicola]